MICQLYLFWIKRAAIVLFLLSGLAALLPVSALATQSVTFAWDPSTDTNVVGYNIYYGTASHVYTSKVPFGNVTIATVSGLVEGTTYYFAATTSDALNQESDFSDEISYTVPVVILNQPPTITGMLTTNTAIAGQNVTFSVTASGTGPLTYQWMYNANNIAAATNAVLTLSNVTAAQAGTYYVNVSNSAGSTNSVMVSLTVYSTMAATLVPASHLIGQFALNISGVTNYPYVVQASTNLVDWVSVQTNTAPFTFVDSNASQFSQRFYRAVLQQ
jgi:Immunoglobulin domain